MLTYNYIICFVQTNALDSKYQFFDPGVVCRNVIALGMENDKIRDNQITASSEFSVKFQPSNAPLNLTDKVWAAEENDLNQWLQVDFQQLTIVTGISTQGQRDKHAEFVTHYSISVSEDGENIHGYKHGEVLKVR